MTTLDPSHPPTTPNTTTPFKPNPHYNFPPFFTLQPNLTTRQSQLSSWSALLLSYCAHHRLFRLSSSHPIFTNTALNRRLKPEDVRVLFAFMVAQKTADWFDSTTTTSTTSSSSGSGIGAGSEKEEVLIWTRSPEEWANSLLKYVEDTGQRNTVLTFYELLEGDATEGCEWRGMGVEGFERVVGVLVRRGRGSVFGGSGGEGRGVKIW